MGKREIIDPKLTVKPEIYALLDPYHKALADVLQERGEIRMITAPEAPDKKPVPVLKRSIVNSLDPFHQAAAEVMEKRGMILVNEDTKLQGEHEKSVLKIHSDVFNSLGGFHQGLACALEKKGKVKIERGSQLFTVPAEVFAQLGPIEKIIIRRQADRGEVRIIEPAEDKNAAVFQASSIRAMSPMEQEVAKMLEDKGYIKIVEPTTETPKGGRHRKVNSGSKNTSVIEVSQHEVSFFERNYPIHHQVLLELIARGEARILEPAISKNAAVFQASSIRGMSRKEAKIARILEDTGYIQMVPTTGTHQLPTIPDSIKKQRKIVEVYPKVKV